MSRISGNVIANYVGSLWAALLSVAFVPIYIRFIGIESYGVIAFVASVQALSYVLDFGLSQGTNRELAMICAQDGGGQEARDLVRTVESFYWTAALLLGITMLVISGPVCRYWVNAQNVSPELIEKAFLIMGFTLALRWPTSLYIGALNGLQKQVLRNVLRVLTSTLGSGGGALVLWQISPTLQALLLWQMAVAALETLLMCISLWASLPRGLRRSRVRKSLFQRMWKFSAGLTAISVTGIVLTQMDRLVLVRFLPLESFGYYSLAAAVAGSISLSISPISAAIFPKFCELVALRRIDTLREYYHLNCQIVSAAVLPLTALIAIYPDAILMAWTHDPIISQKTSGILRILIVGQAISAILTPCYSLQLAYGWTSLTLCIHLVDLAVFPPLAWLLASNYGAEGAAVTVVALFAFHLVVVVPLAHRRILTRDLRAFYLKDLLAPLSLVGAVGLFSYWLMPTAMNNFQTVIWLGFVLGGLACSAVLGAPKARSYFINKIKRANGFKAVFPLRQ